MTMSSIPRNDALRSPSAQKNLLRKQLIQTRSAYSTDYKKQCDQKIGQHLIRYVEEQHIQQLGIYLPIRGEPDLLPAFRQLHHSGVSLAVPVVITQDAPLIYAQWQPDTIMIEGAFRTQVPEQVIAVKPQAILLPCVGFNTARYRLGYGGGYFDRTLSTQPDLHTIGIAYAAALCSFEHEAHDIPMHVIVTETDND